MRKQAHGHGNCALGPTDAEPCGRAIRILDSKREKILLISPCANQRDSFQSACSTERPTARCGKSSVGAPVGAYRGSVLITSDLPFAQWDPAFADNATMTAAMLDRLLLHAHVGIVSGDGFRRRGLDYQPSKKKRQWVKIKSAKP